MIKPLALALMLCLGATQAIAATVTVSGTTTESNFGGPSILAGDSFLITAEVSEPPTVDLASSTTYQLDSLTAEVGFETFSLIAPTSSAVLELTALGSRSEVLLFMSAGTFTSSADADFGFFIVEWTFDRRVGSTFADLAALDFSSATSSFFVIVDDDFADLVVGEIAQTTFTVPAAIPLPAAGWLMLAGLGGLGLARHRSRA